MLLLPCHFFLSHPILLPSLESHQGREERLPEDHSLPRLGSKCHSYLNTRVIGALIGQGTDRKEEASQQRSASAERWLCRSSAPKSGQGTLATSLKERREGGMHYLLIPNIHPRYTRSNLFCFLSLLPPNANTDTNFQKASVHLNKRLWSTNKIPNTTCHILSQP